MKHCPSCQTSYTDETLKYCLQDGTPLEESFDSGASDMPTVAFNDDAAETIVSSRRVEPFHVPVQSPLPVQPPPVQQREQIEQPRIVVPPPMHETKKPKTGLTVLLTTLGILSLLALGGIGAWLFMNDKNTEVAVNVNTGAPKTNRPLNANLASNQDSNLNVAVNTNTAPSASPSQTPTPKATIDPEVAKAAANDVKNVVDEWKSASEDLDLDGHLSQYADTVDYYTIGKINQARVRADKQRAFETFDSIKFNISNMKVTPDATGEKATAVFDKEWSFEGAEKNSSGKVQQLLTLNKVDGIWLITGEKDLKVYYVNNK